MRLHWLEARGENNPRRYGLPAEGFRSLCSLHALAMICRPIGLGLDIPDRLQHYALIYVSVALESYVTTQSTPVHQNTSTPALQHFPTLPRFRSFGKLRYDTLPASTPVLQYSSTPTPPKLFTYMNLLAFSTILFPFT